jgi:hypothetical protein
LRQLVDDSSRGEFRPFVERLLDLIVFLERDGSDDEVFGTCFEFLRPPEITLGRGRGSTLDVWCDYYDLAEAMGRSRELHYRMSIHRERAKLSRDVRTTEISAAARTIRSTLGLKGGDG